VTDEEDRLRRQLRALTAVNRQLQAQLEGSGVRAVALPPGTGPAGPDLLTGPAATHRATAVRRGSVGTTWLEQLATQPTADRPVLVRRSDGATLVVEGTVARPVKAGLLIDALEAHLGRRREATDDEVSSWHEGPPVEVLEGPTGPPFLVVGGRRLPLRGLPLPYPVRPEAATAFPTGPEVRVTPGARGGARRRLSPGKLSPRKLAARARRSSARHGGVVPAARTFGQRQLRRFGRQRG
jgi:hypothetical protein